MSDKIQFTKKLVAQSEIWALEDAMEHWWQNRHGGWRLTAVGLEAFRQYKLEHWDFVLEKVVLSPSLLLTLDRKLTGPYYIQVGKTTKLYFFDSKEATMYALYGDIRRFIAAINS